MWSDEVEKISSAVYQVSSQIKSAGKKLCNKDLCEIDYQMLADNILRTLNYWTGKTYVGIEKDKTVRKAFQSFFTQLYSFLMICRDSNIKELQKFAKRALYQGVLYRYLGHGDVSEDCDSRVEPQYNDIYVSWSKNSENSYIESKLYGVITLIECEVSGNYYGIDLGAFGVVRGNEAEVVFPTIKETVKDISYIS